jgi:hypothetical protein
MAIAMSLRLVIGVALMATSAAELVAQRDEDPWAGFKSSTAWVAIGEVDSPHERWTSTDQSMPIIPKYRRGLLPVAGDIIQLRSPRELILTGYRRSGEDQRLVPPGPRPSDEDRTGVILPEGARLIVTAIAFAKRTEGFLSEVVWARVSPAANSPFEVQAALRSVPRTREIRTNLPIPAQLQPADEVVRVKKSAIVDYVYYGNETPAQEIARSVRDADAIAVFEADTVEAALVEGDTWIRTRVSGRVTTALKNPGLFSNGRVDVQFDGGGMRINGVEVRAGGYPILKPGSRYLAFIQTNGDDRWLGWTFDVTNAREVTRPEFADVDPATIENAFKGQSLEAAVREMRKSLPK